MKFKSIIFLISCAFFLSCSPNTKETKGEDASSIEEIEQMEQELGNKAEEASKKIEETEKEVDDLLEGL